MMLNYIQRVFGLAFADMKSHELMNLLQGIRVLESSPHRSAAVDLFEVVLNLVLEPLHPRHSRRRLIVDQYWSIEIALCEHARDMLQMHSYLCAILNIVRAVGCYLDGATRLL